MSPHRRPMTPHRRLTAWLITGPLGHLAAGIVEWMLLFRRWAWARARGRDPWGSP